MKQWDIFLFPFDEEKPHPVVILPPDERVGNRKFVNGLLVTTSARRCGSKSHRSLVEWRRWS